MELTVPKEELKTRCEEIIVNVKSFYHKLIESCVRDEVKKRKATKRFLRASIPATNEEVDRFLADKKHLEEISEITKAAIKLHPRPVLGANWLHIAEKTLSALKHHDKEMVTLTTADEMSLLDAWRTMEA